MNILKTFYLLILFFYNVNVIAEETTYRARTALYKLEFNVATSEIKTLYLLNYQSDSQNNHQMMINAATEHPHQMLSSLMFDKDYSAFSQYTITSTKKDKQGNLQLISFSANNPDGIKIIKTYHFDGTYALQLKTTLINDTKATVSTAVQYAFNHITQDNSHLFRPFDGYIAYTDGGSLTKIKARSLLEEPLMLSIDNGWFGIKTPFFQTIWAPQDKSEYSSFSKVTNQYLLKSGIISKYKDILPGQTVTYESKAYVGPLEKNAILQSNINGLDKTLDYGFLSSVSNFMLDIITSLNKLTHNYGFSIILLGILLKLILMPFEMRSFKSAFNLEKYKDQLSQMMDQHADNPEMQQLKTREFSKQHQINPFISFFFGLAQLPIMMAIFWMLMTDIHLRHAPFILWINDLTQPDPYYVLPLIYYLMTFIDKKPVKQTNEYLIDLTIKFMPFLITFIFALLPSGLVLLIVTNTALSKLFNRYYKMA